MADAELFRLEEIERLAYQQLARVSRPNGISDPGVLSAARQLWVEAAAAVRLYKSL